MNMDPKDFQFWVPLLNCFVEFIGYLYGTLTDLFEARKLKMTTRKWLKVSLS